jgi:hypothetical protein
LANTCENFQGYRASEGPYRIAQPPARMNCTISN